jgi:hypothetical protein
MNCAHRAGGSMTCMLGIVTLGSLLALWGGGGCGVDNAIVGGTCASGYSPCGDTCCLGGLPDGGSLDGALDARRDGRETDGQTEDSRTGDALTRDTSGDACTPPYESVEQCGACTTACSGTDVCSPTDGGPFECASKCSAPLEACKGTCVDESDDPNNCGRCEQVCASGFCAASACTGTIPGDIVIIGYDYHVSKPQAAEATLLSNAAFLATRNPLRVLSFEEYADPKSVSNVKGILSTEAAALGRTIAFTADTDIPTDLGVVAFDELIVYDQEAAPPGVLGPLGSSWQSTLSTFTAEGGVVLSLDGAAGTTQEMPLFNTSAGLLAISSHTVVAVNTALDVTGPGDAVADGVVTPFASELDSVYFTTSVPSGGDVTYVVADPTDAGQAPVVVHIDVTQ